MPTVKDAVPGYEVTTWYSLVAPAHTPPSVVERLNREIADVLASPAIQEKLRVQGLEPDPMAPAALGKLFSAESARWAKVIAQRKLTVN